MTLPPIALRIKPCFRKPCLSSGSGECVRVDARQPVGTSLEDGYSKASFGTFVIGNRGPAKKFTIRNLGKARLTGLTVTRSGVNAREFKVIQATKTSLAPGASTTFTVAFRPAGKGSRSAVIHIKSNDADEASFDVILTGKGQVP